LLARAHGNAAAYAQLRHRIATNPFLVVELAHPYVSAVSTSSDHLQEVVAVLSQPVR
jgi:hypothetical protein